MILHYVLGPVCFISFYYIYFFCVYGDLVTYHNAHVKVRELTCVSVLSFPYAGPVDIRFGGKQLYLLSHFTGLFLLYETGSDIV